MKIHFKNSSGFSLPEIMTVVVIIVILLSITTAYIGNIRIKARDTKRLADISEVQMALQMYKHDQGIYPSSLSPGDQIVGPSGKVYLEKMPHDPNPDDGDCKPGDGYDFDYSINKGGLGYQVAYCLGNGNNKIPAGIKVAIPDNPYCSPDCSTKCNGGIESVCGIACNGSCPSGFSCVDQTCQAPPGENWTHYVDADCRDLRYGLICNNDCSHIMGMNYSSGIKISYDSGVTWGGPAYADYSSYRSVAGSSDMTKTIGVTSSYSSSLGARSHRIMLSTDSGQHWTKSLDLGNISNGTLSSSSAMSADGSKIVVAIMNQHIWTSSNGGSTWVEQTSSPIKSWYKMASSSDCNILIAISDDGDWRTSNELYVSLDGGANWSLSNSTENFVSVAMSDDGAYMYAAAGRNNIYKSTDHGATWVSLSGNGYGINKSWQYISCSSDGQVVAAVQSQWLSFGYDPIYISTDGGASWEGHRIYEGDGDRSHYYYVKVAPNGSRIILPESGKYIYTSP